MTRKRYTLTEVSSIDGPNLAPVHGPIEPVPSVTGSGTLLTGGRPVARIGHSPDLMGNAATTGRPTGWVETLPDPTALPASEIKRGRNKRGTTARVIGPWPTHRITTGEADYCDPVADMVASLTRTDEVGLQHAADSLMSRDAAMTGRDWPRLLGSGYGHHEQLPERIPGDRSSAGATSSDDADYVDSGAVLDGMRLAASAGVLHRRPVMRTTFKRNRGKLVRTTTVEDLGNDQPAPRPVTLPLCIDRNGSASYGDSATTIADRNVARFTIRRANRLRKCVRPYRVAKDGAQVTGTHKVGCTCQHDAAGIAVLGKAVTYDAQGSPREVELLGRREADRTLVVGWGDGGYWLGHRFVRDEVRAPASVKPATALAKRRADKAASERKRAAAKRSDAARLDAILAKR